MDAKSLVEEAKHLDGYYKDLAGISSRVFPDKSLEEGVEVIAEFVLGYEQMWHDAGNQETVISRCRTSTKKFRLKSSGLP